MTFQEENKEGATIKEETMWKYKILSGKGHSAVAAAAQILS